MARESDLVKTFVALADTLTDDFDVIDFLQTLAERCVELLDVSAAGIMLVDGQGVLRHAACSSEAMLLVELFELQVSEGPCYDAFRQHAPVVCGSPEEAAERWPTFAPKAVEHGFAAVAGMPMRLRKQVIGALNLFSDHRGELGKDDAQLVQAMADVATIGILQQRTIKDAATLTTQHEGALNSRVTIEQAKGIVAEQSGTSVDDAFLAIRDYTRAHNRLLSDTARRIVEGSLSAGSLTVTAQPPSRRDA
jgi:GAF domain-containing protein